ncbi:chaperone protein EcpD [Enterobacter cancerogenus]|uniref:Chaperone protein EcpD n=2 Tax=Enterobacter cancerogenus TaxID=69218 RepID=A0A484WRD2_9ENTR|nr:chaperone protein EcpD [Enterobacter cancerogenus]
MTWSAKKDGNTVQLVAHNNSPYNVAISKVTLKAGQKSYDVAQQSVLPFSEKAMTVKGLSSTTTGSVMYETINDNGGVDKHETKLN